MSVLAAVDSALCLSRTSNALGFFTAVAASRVGSPTARTDETRRHLRHATRSAEDASTAPVGGWRETSGTATPVE